MGLARRLQLLWWRRSRLRLVHDGVELVLGFGRLHRRLAGGLGFVHDRVQLVRTHFRLLRRRLGHVQRGSSSGRFRGFIDHGVELVRGLFGRLQRRLL